MATVLPTLATVTALSIIKRAMRMCGAYSLGEEPSADEVETGLGALNGLIGSLSNSPLQIFAQTTDIIPMVANTSVYTVGLSGTVVTARPVSVVDACYVVYQSVSYPCPLMSQEQYDQIIYKPQTQEYPIALWYRADYPDGTLTVYPTPTASSSLYFVSNKVIAEFSSGAQEVQTPPGYYDMLSSNLAVNWGPEFGASVPDTIVRMAASTKRAIGKTNTRVPSMNLPSVVLPQRGYVNWRTGA
jgi:hypothetical protein